MNTPFLDLRSASCIRPSGAAVHDVSLSFGLGTFNFLEGDEHSGKNLLLRMLGLLEAPDRGEILVGGRSIAGWTETSLAELRNSSFGYIFTAPFLLPTFTVVENVAMPLFKIAGVNPNEARVRTEKVMGFADLDAVQNERVADLPAEMQRRVSLARALAHGPAALIVEDLDVGIDGSTAQQFASLLRGACDTFGVAVIATASASFPADKDDRVIAMTFGKVRSDSRLVVET